MTCKKILTVGLEVAIITTILAPILVLAQADDAGGPPTGAKGICARLSTIIERTGQRITERDSKLETKRAEISNKIETRRSERDSKLEMRREKWDTNRAEHFAKLEERAQTDEQKQAVLSFTEAVTAAIAERRAAISNAIQDFRDGVNEATASRKESVDELVRSYRDSIQSTFAKAESDCEGGVDPKTVREDLRTTQKAIRAEFISDKQEIEKIKVSMESLITAKREAIKTAIEDFKAEVEEARDRFKAAFTPESPEPAEPPEPPEPSESPEPPEPPEL